MARIPVGQTIAFAYSFTIGNIPAILGLQWLQLLVIGLGVYFFVPAYFSAIASTIATQSSGPVLAMLGAMILVMLVNVAMFSMIYSALVRLALHRATGPIYVNTMVDAAFWRIIKAYLLVTLLYVGILIAGTLVIRIVALLSRSVMGEGAAGAVLDVADVTFSVFAIYILLRVSFLIPPVSVVEESAVVRRSWDLTRGNSWQILVVLLAILAPFFAGMLIISAVLSGILPGDPPRPDAAPELAVAYFNDVATRLSSALPWIIPIGMLLYAMLFGLMSSAATFAYCALTAPNNGKGDVSVA